MERFGLNCYVMPFSRIPGPVSQPKAVSALLSICFSVASVAPKAQALVQLHLAFLLPATPGSTPPQFWEGFAGF